MAAMVLALMPAQAQVFEPTTFTLDNGMQVVVVENHRAPVVTHMVWYKVGAADEPPGKSGLAHFFEHLMFKGTEAHGPGEFSDIVARYGGRENAFTSQDYTAYYQTVAPEHLEKMMELEADRMQGLVLTEEVIEPERRVILEERRSRVENDPASQLSEQVGTTTYMNHPYRLPVIGWAHEIAGLSRQDLIDFYRTWYAPDNAVLVVAGDVDPEAVRTMAERWYGAVPAGNVPPRERPSEPPQVAPREVVLHDARVEQPSWSRRYLAPSYRTAEGGRAYALEVLAEIVGGGSTGRLYRALVVEAGLAAAAGAWYSPDMLDIGTFGLYFSPRPGTEMDEIEAVLDGEIERLLADGVGEDEVKRAKQRLVDGAVFARDSVSGPARVFGSALATGQSVEDVEDWPARIEAVTREDVNAAARAVIDAARSTTGILLPAVTEGRT